MDMRRYQTSARSKLRRFRQGSMVAVAITALLLLLGGGPPDSSGQQEGAETPEPAAEIITPGETIPQDAGASIEEATGTIRELILTFWGILPKIVIGVILIVLAGLIANGIRAALHRFRHRWEKSEAIAALVRIGCYLLAIAVALSILAGDARALLGSIGLVGLALSWALQTPIESFTGWLLNSFRSYYRVGDRIEVGEVFGDVYRIDVLTTTVWEAGGPGKSVTGAQSTGAMITFPNWEVLRSNIVNYSRDFPFVWDEVTFAITNESDLAYTIGVLERTAASVIGPQMADAAAQYRNLLERARLAFDVDPEPKVFLSLSDAWTNCTVRYLVSARARRRSSTALILGLSQELARPEHRGRIVSAYPRTEVLLREKFSAGDTPAADDA